MFYDPALFPFLEPLRENWLTIRAEYDAVKHKRVVWPEAFHNGGWSTVTMRYGDKVLPVMRMAPRTAAFCNAIPGVRTIAFSILKPGAELLPHHGYTDTVLRAHLGLYTNPDCALKIGDQQQSWRDGELMVFCDASMHSAWNHGNTTRAVLIVDFDRAPNTTTYGWTMTPPMDATKLIS